MGLTNTPEFAQNVKGQKRKKSMTPREKAIMFIGIHRTAHLNDPDKVELRDGMKEFLKALHGDKLDVEQVLQDVDAYDPELHKEVTKWIKWCREDLKV